MTLCCASANNKLVNGDSLLLVAFRLGTFRGSGKMAKERYFRVITFAGKFQPIPSLNGNIFIYKGLFNTCVPFGNVNFRTNCYITDIVVLNKLARKPQNVIRGLCSKARANLRPANFCFSSQNWQTTGEKTLPLCSWPSFLRLWNGTRKRVKEPYFLVGANAPVERPFASKVRKTQTLNKLFFCFQSDPLLRFS